MPDGPVHEGTAEAYDVVADAYADQYYLELEKKPFDRDVLTAFAKDLAGPGIVADIGCGPGQVARFLTEQGLPERGIEGLGFDLSPRMVELARDRNPSIRFEVADVRALPLPDCALVGAAAFYSLIHIPRQEITAVFTELCRVLRPGGPLLISFHIGEGVTHIDTWFEKPVSLGFTFFGLAEMAGYASEAGLELETTWVRPAYPFEVQTERAYLRLHSPRS